MLLLVRERPRCALFTQADLAMFESIAWRAAIALVNARLYDEIEQADQQKNRFLSMLAHELRNPLAPIRSAVDVLRLCGDRPARHRLGPRRDRPPGEPPGPPGR